MDRLETMLDLGALPLKGGRKVHARQVSQQDEAVLLRASMSDPASPLEIVTPHGVVTAVVAQGRSLGK